MVPAMRVRKLSRSKRELSSLTQRICRKPVASAMDRVQQFGREIAVNGGA
jgi:hypothetical protein